MPLGYADREMPSRHIHVRLLGGGGGTLSGEMTLTRLGR